MVPRTLLLVAHGFPPTEGAGTEQHADALARALAARGHRVHVFAATRAPGRAQYSQRDERLAPGLHLTRIVNNTPGRPLAQAERDPAVDAAFAALCARLRPDLVHVHHLQFLSSALRAPCPVALTLHDRWHWCAAGGTGLAADGRPCPGPTPARCAPCAAAWRPVHGGLARGLMGLAGALAPWVRPERLHTAWARAAPAALRRRAGAPRPAQVEPPSAAAARNAAMIAFARACAWRFAPSRALAAEAEAQGLGPVELLPNGLPPEFFSPHPGVARDGPILMLGSMAPHKGPDLVVQAWRAACPGGQPALELRGPPPPGGAVLGHRVLPALDRAQVIAALDRSRALVMGSRWAENAPLVLLEARARGAPVVAPRAGGVPELVEEGRDGLLYRPGDADDLARALREVLRRSWSPRPPPQIGAVADRIEALLSSAAPAGGPPDRGAAPGGPR